MQAGIQAPRKPLLVSEERQFAWAFVLHRTVPKWMQKSSLESRVAVHLWGSPSTQVEEQPHLLEEESLWESAQMPHQQELRLSK
jgi:hypothetical protein